MQDAITHFLFTSPRAPWLERILAWGEPGVDGVNMNEPLSIQGRDTWGTMVTSQCDEGSEAQKSLTS